MKITKENIKVNSPENRKIEDLYVRAFPEIERLPYDTMISYTEGPQADLWAYYIDQDFLGFSYVMITEEMVYILFFATEEKYRSKGCGSQIVQEIIDSYPDKAVVLDIEPLDDKAENAKQRSRRAAFYEKLGFSDTFFEMTDETGDYRIYTTKPESFDTDVFKKTWGIYPPCFEGTLIVDKHPNE